MPGSSLQLRRDVPLLETLRGLQVLGAGGVIGAGVLALAVQEEPVHLARQVVVVGDVALRAPAVVEPMEAALQAPHMAQGTLEGTQTGGAEIAAEQVEEVVERSAVLDRQRAVHPGLAGMEAGIERQLPVQLGVVQPDRDGGLGLAAEDVALAVGVDHGEPTDPDQWAEHP